MNEIVEIPIKKIKVGGYGQRLEIEDESIAGLASSIGRLGVLYPLVVYRKANEYILVEGHRRLKACKKMGLQKVPCMVRDIGEKKSAEIAFAGNFFREDLSPVELACAISDCIEKEEMTVSEIAAGLHRSEHWVKQMVAITFWPKDVQEAIHNEKISVSAANNLACVTDDSYRVFLVRNAIEQGATARTTASWLQAWRAMQPASEAITSEPVSMGSQQTPLVPQAPCLCCGEIFPVDKMSHVPLCGNCIQVIRQVGIKT